MFADDCQIARRLLAAVACVGLLAFVPVGAFAQEPSQPTQPTAPTGPGTLPTGVPDIPAGPITPPGYGPLPELRELISVEAGRQGPFTVTPTLAVSEEYNDNVFLSNLNKQSDFITAFTPGGRVVLQKENYRLLGGGDFSGQLYAKNSSLNGVNSGNVILEGLYRVDPRLSLTLGERFGFSKNTNAVSLQGVSTGRASAQTNDLTTSVAWQAAPLDTLRFTAGWSHSTFGTPTTGSSTGTSTSGTSTTAAGLNSDIYRAEVGEYHVLTPRLTGSVAYRFAYLDIQGTAPVTTHSPRLGATYQITPTLTGTVNAGPEFEVVKGSTSVHAGASASLAKTFKWGGISAIYDRSIGSSGGLSGASENQSVALLVQWTTLARGLALELSPRYATVKSTGQTTGQTTSQTTGSVDLQSFTVTARATYLFNRWLTGFVNYTFFKQITSGNSAGTDVDQNLVRIGIQFGYPIRFD